MKKRPKGERFAERILKNLDPQLESTSQDLQETQKDFSKNSINTSQANFTPHISEKYQGERLHGVKN